MPKQFGPTSRMPCRERDLGRARRAGEFAARHAGQLTVEPGEQRRVIRAGLTADPARLALGVERAELNKRRYAFSADSAACISRTATSSCDVARRISTVPPSVSRANTAAVMRSLVE